MATDNRTEHSLFPDVSENYERQTATAESAPQQSSPVQVVEPPPVPTAEPAVDQAPVPVPEPAREESPGELLADAVHPHPDASPEPDPGAELPAEFDQMPTWLVSPESPTAEPKKRKKRDKRDKREKAEKPENVEPLEKAEPLDKAQEVEQIEQIEQDETKASEPGGRKLLLIGAAVALVAIASAATVVVLQGGDTATAGTPKPVAAASTSATSSTSTSPEAAAPAPAWCAESAADGRSVGRGPGSTSDGPGVIRAFDHAYYVERDGARVASLMVAPNAVPEIQKFIDGVSLGTEHCVTIASTPDPNVYNVDLELRSPGASDGVIRQRITVAPSPEGFKIAKVEDMK
ncbi:hypothetical protein [Prescottella agglutinans]|uniref:hypothetical protein n=1 Tax=Prescottella agglutinans TaxID=1644129 RepID=UPI003D987CE5